MPTFSVYINYPSRRTKMDSGISLDFHNNYLRSFNNIKDAIKFVQSHNIKPHDALYIIEHSDFNKIKTNPVDDLETETNPVSNDKSVYYRCLTKEGYIS